MKNHRLICITVRAFLLLICAQVINAQEVEHDILFSTSARISYKPYKFLKLNIVPEFRFNDSFTPKRISAEFQVDYQPIKFLKISASYGLVSKNPFQSETKTTAIMLWERTLM